MESNKKPGTEAEGRLQTVISELDVTIGDLLDKADFALMELMEVVAVHVDNTPDDKAKKINRVNGLADIAYDYVARAQSALTSIILRERREQRQEPRTPAGDAQEIIRRIQQIKDPALLTKISDFVESWSEDEGGQADE
ncbi:MAG: hypothetical protein HFG34_00680 [Eubacterium sp.]|nr:hypothetical protein [Eubacterium sp.]MCI9658584.1 hypothetical protein [Lachnospiraceae bacterium]